MLRNAKNDIKNHNTPIPSPHLLDIHPPICTSYEIPNHPDCHDCVRTWPDSIDDVAVEELEIPDCSNFGDALYILNNPRTKILYDYYDLLVTNINPDFVAACPNIITFMKGPIALKVFCPETWTGIIDLEPLELKFNNQLSLRHRPALQPVKSALLENAKVEFDRLLSTLYCKSDSPIASPLVIAPKSTPPYQRWCGDYTWINKFIEPIQCYVPIVFSELEKHL
jgi:hypothetical protein